MTNNAADDNLKPQALTRKQLRAAAEAAGVAEQEFNSPSEDQLEDTATGSLSEQSKPPSSEAPSPITALSSSAAASVAEPVLAEPSYNNSQVPNSRSAARAEQNGWHHIVSSAGAVEISEEQLTVGSYPSKKKRKRFAGCLIAIVIMLAVVAAAIWAIFTFGPKIQDALGRGELDDWEQSDAHGEVIFVVNQGDSPCSISPALFEAGVTKSKNLLCDYVLKESLEPKFYAGSYSLQLQMTAPAVVAVLSDESNIISSQIILPEGLTAQQSIARLAEATGIELSEFETAISDPSKYGIKAQSIEGWLYPTNYSFAPDLSAEQIIQEMVSNTEAALDRAGVAREDRHKILTIASIIQREGTSISDFEMISRVIQNRLDPGNTVTGGRLEMDSTVQYGYGELHNGSVSTSAQAVADDNPWNTYMHAGLPIGPIANPGQDAIDSAMNPATGDWMFFATVNLATGETIFSNTYAEHLQAVAQWQQWCADNPNQGC